VYFGPNDTRLTATARDRIAELVVRLNEYPSVPVSIVGHTALFGTEEGRMEISRGRAQAVERELRNLGWRPQTPPQLGWVGSSEPVTRDPDRQNENRRVRIRTVPRDE
jgi:outer membrane protein OmpA-like peptidoglycan-associated protein